jgi:hypothetical protein
LSVQLGGGKVGVWGIFENGRQSPGSDPAGLAVCRIYLGRTESHGRAQARHGAVLPLLLGAHCSLNRNATAKTPCLKPDQDKEAVELLIGLTAGMFGELPSNQRRLPVGTWLPTLRLPDLPTTTLCSNPLTPY